MPAKTFLKECQQDQFDIDVSGEERDKKNLLYEVFLACRHRKI
jgi:hypothetical protein